ncbi:hypothetical protein PsAD26_00568 [Pseudovibrio sp. Ad26]|nr:hypothetical protein PsAD26_00568 [Pseudovibrio sp. Ad26]
MNVELKPQVVKLTIFTGMWMAGVSKAFVSWLMPERVALDPGFALRLCGMTTGGVRTLWRAGRSKPADSQAGLFPSKGYFIHHPPAHNKGLVRFMHEDGMRQLLCQTGSFDRDAVSRACPGRRRVVVVVR